MFVSLPTMAESLCTLTLHIFLKPWKRSHSTVCISSRVMKASLFASDARYRKVDILSSDRLTIIFLSPATSTAGARHVYKVRLFP